MFKVAIVGRPNVGKSTLFNRLAGRRLALVDDRPGVTRDWRSAPAQLGGLHFMIIDTAGLEEAREGSLEARMRLQTERALELADVALMLVDARAGVTPMDHHFADILRKSGTPVIVVANKAEGRAGAPGTMEAFELGLGEPVPISAEHGEGLGDLYDALRAYAPEDALEPIGEPEPVEPILTETEAEIEEGEEIPLEDVEPSRPIQVAIVGRPNVGKSTLLNALLGEERVLTGPEAGMTRDAITAEWEWGGRQFMLVDTAGMRRRANITDKLEKLSVSDGLRATRLAQVVVLVLDADTMFDKQDLTIARMVVEEGRALVIAVNKWDKVEDRQAAMQHISDRLQTSLPQVRGVPVVTISALNGIRLDQLLEQVITTYDIWNRRIPTAQLNRWLAGVTEAHPPPLVEGRRIKIRYATQIKARPPTVALWVSKPVDLPDSYTRYLVNSLRETFDMPGVPIRMLLRKTKNPYADRD